MSTILQNRNLPQLLLQAREALMKQFRPLLNEFGVTEQQWRILRSLLDEGPLEPRQLCERCIISSPSIAGVLLRMEEADLIVRERMGHDQRRVKVSMTRKSRALATRMAPRVAQCYAAIEAKLGADYTSRMYATLDTLIETLGSSPVEGE